MIADSRQCLLACALAVIAPHATASFHTFAIEQIYSNADGTVQFVVMHETAGSAGQHLWSGHALTMTHAGVSKTFTFPTDLPNSATAGKRVLIGTQALASLGFIAPDYLIPDGFLATDGATLDYGGADVLTYAPLPIDGASAMARGGASMPNRATNFADATVALPALTVTAIEYYNASLDHYFISDLQPDLDALDSGRIGGWTRTGGTFRVFPSQGAGGASVNPVCRFYIPPEHGNSHFFSASPTECAAVNHKTTTDPNYSGYVFESPNVFYLTLPDTTTGACPAGTAPVYRLWNQRADSNHRYTSDVAIKVQMLGKSYVAEGYGPNAVNMCSPLPGVATLKFTGAAAPPEGVLVNDGLSGANGNNYQGFVATTDSVAVGTHMGTGEAIAFAADRAVALQPVLWTTAFASQTVNVPLADAYETPVTIWVVAGPYANTQQTALMLWQTASQIYADERFGVRMTSVEIVDATANPKAATWNAFTCGATGGNVAAIQADIGARAGRMNVYLVGLVDGSTSRGNACVIGGAFVAIAAGSGAELLAHELGHDFALEHVDDIAADFDVTNVMHSASWVRHYLTEGQTFRAHLRSNSAINAVYNARPGLPVRNCDRDTVTRDCPLIRKRLWSDGAFPAN